MWRATTVRGAGLCLAALVNAIKRLSRRPVRHDPLYRFVRRWWTPDQSGPRIRPTQARRPTKRTANGRSEKASTPQLDGLPETQERDVRGRPATRRTLWGPARFSERIAETVAGRGPAGRPASFSTSKDFPLGNRLSAAGLPDLLPHTALT